MKVIVSTEIVPGSGTTTSVYLPEGGAENATDETLRNTMRKLWERDYNAYRTEINEEFSHFGDDEAVIYAKSFSITYEILKVITLNL